MISGAMGDRTPDLMTASHALSQLSYSPKEQVARDFPRGMDLLSAVFECVKLIYCQWNHCGHVWLDLTTVVGHGAFEEII